jgi:hypothetical protein
MGIRAYCRWIVSYSWWSMTTLIFHIKVIFLHYIDSIIANITFFTHLCLHYSDPNGSFEAHIEVMHMGWNQFKWTKNYVKMSIFSNLFSHLSMWCHFNGMFIMASCDLSLIWMLQSLNYFITCFNFEFRFEQKTFNNFINQHYFDKGPFNYHNTNFIIFKMGQSMIRVPPFEH